MIQTFPADAKLPDDRWPGVFVFGANELGVHGASAARVARDIPGYRTGLHDVLNGAPTGPEGQGLAYGISTKIEEGNSWGDQFWGVTPSGVSGDFRGQNHLGILLMKIRAELRNE